MSQKSNLVALEDSFLFLIYCKGIWLIKVRSIQLELAFRRSLLTFSQKDFNKEFVKKLYCNHRRSEKTEISLWIGCKGKWGQGQKEASRSRYKGAFSQGETRLIPVETEIKRGESEMEEDMARISVKDLAFVLVWISRDTCLKITK